MRDPFKKASRRIIRRLGRPVSMLKQDGVRLEMLGIFESPEKGVIIKGKGGGLTVKSDVPTLTVLSEKCPPLIKELQIFIDDEEYYPIPSQSFDDKAGCIVIVLALNIPEKIPGEESDDGGRWR